MFTECIYNVFCIHYEDLCYAICMNLRYEKLVFFIKYPYVIQVAEAKAVLKSSGRKKNIEPYNVIFHSAKLYASTMICTKLP